VAILMLKNKCCLFLRKYSSATLRGNILTEMQDLNNAQIHLVLHFMQEHPSCHLLSVGDPDQAIYMFWGASEASMETFIGMFENIQQFDLNLAHCCPISHIALAWSLVDRIVGGSATQGTLLWAWVHEAKPRDLVISRQNLPIVRAALDLVKLCKKAAIVGDDDLKVLLLSFLSLHI
jgi:hypothetical protein